MGCLNVYVGAQMGILLYISYIVMRRMMLSQQRVRRDQETGRGGEREGSELVQFFSNKVYV